MHKKKWLAVASFGLPAALATFAHAQERVYMPVYSIEAVEVNSVPVPGGSSGKITVAPGDVILAKIMIRNWSPTGQKLRAYQVQMDPAGYRSGTSGTVQPVGFEPGTPNDSNAYIDIKDPDFIHKGLQSIPVTDAASEGYRWINVLLNAEEGPVSKQDGRKYYCATLRLAASNDAEGTFTIKLVEEPTVSGILDATSPEPVFPVGYEPLVVEVRAGVRWLRILSSDPPDGAVDGRISVSAAGPSDSAWKSIRLIFNGPADGFSPADFAVEDGSASPPAVKDVKVNGSEVVVTLDRGIRSGAWTRITHKASGSSTRIGRLRGDASSDGRLDADDLMVLLRGLNGAAVLTDYQADLDGDGERDARDVLRLIDLLTEKQPRRATLGK